MKQVSNKRSSLYSDNYQLEDKNFEQGAPTNSGLPITHAHDDSSSFSTKLMTFVGMIPKLNENSQPPRSSTLKKPWQQDYGYSASNYPSQRKRVSRHIESEAPIREEPYGVAKWRESLQQHYQGQAPTPDSREAEPEALLRNLRFQFEEGNDENAATNQPKSFEEEIGKFRHFLESTFQGNEAREKQLRDSIRIMRLQFGERSDESISMEQPRSCEEEISKLKHMLTGNARRHGTRASQLRNSLATVQSFERKEIKLQTTLLKLRGKVLRYVGLPLNPGQQSSSCDEEINKLHTLFGDVFEHYEQREARLQQEVQGISDQANESRQMNLKLQADIQELESEKQNIEEKHNTFIRKQQEASFRKMETSHWVPCEDSKVIGDLESLKRDMKGWAKTTSIENMTLLGNLDDSECTALIKRLGQVIVVTEPNEFLPPGLVSTKSPALLLNSLLAHDVYTSFFRTPFFFLGNGITSEDPSPSPVQLAVLEELHQRALKSNQEDAHMWRSQTLRLLLPPIRNQITEEEKTLRSWTEGMVTQVADQQALNFLESPAQHLIDVNFKATCGEKVQTIYRRAAGMAYLLWARRITLKCYTLQEMGNPVFEPENEALLPHASVNCEDHKDQLAGHPITVLVHPLLVVCGSDDGKDYGQERVWAPGEVWLDSRTPPRSQGAPPNLMD